MMGKNQWLRMGFLATMAVAGWCMLSPFPPPQGAAAPQAASANNPAAPRATASREYTLLFTGDVMLSRAVGSRMASAKGLVASLPPDRGHTPQR